MYDYHSIARKIATQVIHGDEWTEFHKLTKHFTVDDFDKLHIELMKITNRLNSVIEKIVNHR